ADVSANNCVEAVFVGETPGTRRARSKKLRPLSGNRFTSAGNIVPATWLRDVSSTGAVPCTVTVDSAEPTFSVTGKSNSAPMVNVTEFTASTKLVSCTRTSYGPTGR